MRRRVPVQNLRGSDPTLLEVQLQDLLGRPLGQLDPINLMDLLELAAHPDRPKSLHRKLAAFAERVAREVNDLPNGKSWEGFLDELDALPAERVPESFRAIMVSEAERDERERERVLALVEGWKGTPPLAFEFGTTKAKVTRTVPQPAKASKTTKGKTKRTTKSATPADPARAGVLRDLCLERLGQVSDSGLGEKVLIVGIRHRASEHLSHVLPHEISAVLKQLKEEGRVRYSAGRWSRVARW